MVKIFKNMVNIKLTRLHQIILFGTFVFISFYFLISIMDNISLISINSDSNKLSIDVEAIDYQEIENLVRLMANSGVDISIGSSRRSNNLLIGELDVENF